MLQPFPAFGGLEVLVAGLDHPEGVALDPSTGELVSAGEDGHVWRIDPEARSVRDVARVPGQVLGVAVDGRGRIVACCSADGSVRVIDTDRTVYELVRDVDGEPLDVPNYPSFGPDGSLYVSASGTWGANDGRIVRVTPTAARRPSRGAWTASRTGRPSRRTAPRSGSWSPSPRPSTGSTSVRAAASRWSRGWTAPSRTAWC
jgi:sugar lactone lactonase YvrE